MTKREKLKMMIDTLSIDTVQDVSNFVFGRVSAEMKEMFREILNISQKEEKESDKKLS